MGHVLIVVLAAGVLCGVQLFERTLPPGVEPRLRMLAEPPPLVTIIAVTAIATVSLLQLTVAPSLLDALQRDRSAIADGELWRVVTALLVQDGGVAGTVFNIASLVVLGALAERTIGRPRMIVGWCSGALAGELVGLAWQPIGGGNSVGNLGLVGALAVAATLSGARRPPLVASVAVIGVGGIVLLIGRDVHGAALAGSAIVCAVTFPAIDS